MLNCPENLSALIKKLPLLPGIYQMKDAEGAVLYVGKASNLKNRVSSYFNKNQPSAKTRSLVMQIHAIEISITRSETEALLLESSLIKALSPKYNVLMRDDKSYPYIHVNNSHPFPRIEMCRFKKRPQKGLYFGPYPSAGVVRETLGLLQKIFKIRNCRDSYFQGRSRPCLQYQIKRCTAPCTAYISLEDYQQSIQDAILFLQGKSSLVIESLKARMEKAVAHLDFEEAALLRDQIKSLRSIQESQGLIQAEGELDVIVMEVQDDFACVLAVNVRGGQVVQKESFFPVLPRASLEEEEDFHQAVFDAFVAFYYIDRPERIPGLLLVDENLKKLALTESLLTQLRGKRCRIQTKVRGAKKSWLEFARNNLLLTVKEHQSFEKNMKARYQALGSFLGLENIQKMECFDISHTQGSATVASCVVFDAHGPQKKEYRQFNISGITPGDDFAAMEQVLRRRYKGASEAGQASKLPDLLIIDGGKGQVAVAKRVLESLNITSLALLGIAKGPERKAGWEHLIFKGEEKRLPENSKALHLLQSIRDEAHRFAITKHRKKRQKLGFESSLDAIEGVGAKRRQALLRHFGGKQEIEKAALAEIARVPGISKKLAETIYAHLHPNI